MMVMLGVVYQTILCCRLSELHIAIVDNFLKGYVL